MTTEREVVDSCVCHKVRMAARAVTRVYDAALVQAPGMDHSTLTRNVRPLVKDGLLAVGREGWDRSRTVEITERGRAGCARRCRSWSPDPHVLCATLRRLTVSRCAVTRSADRTPSLPVWWRTGRGRRASRPAWLGRATGPAEQPLCRHSVLPRPAAANRGCAPASSASVTSKPPAAREQAVRLTSHRGPREHAQETVPSSCPDRRPLWAQLS